MYHKVIWFIGKHCCFQRKNHGKTQDNGGKMCVEEMEGTHLWHEIFYSTLSEYSFNYCTYAESEYSLTLKTRIYICILPSDHQLKFE